MQNLGEFLKIYSEKYKERVAFEIKRGFRTYKFSFNEVYILALKTASFLQQNGLKKGDKVAIWAPNMPEYPILYFGCWILGVIAVPLDVRTTEEVVKVFLTKAKCKLGFKGKFIPGDFGKLVKETFYLEDLIEMTGKLPNHLTLSNIEPNDLAEIAFTSGTTGTPKGVILTHGNFLSDVEALTQAFPFKEKYRALSILPLSHAFEQVVDFLAPFKSGIKITYLERINRLTILKEMRKRKITSVVLVPQILQLLMNGIEQEVEKKNMQKTWEKLNSIAFYLPNWLRRILFYKVHQKFGGSLNFFGSGSAPLNTKLAQKWEALGVEVFEGYGATETTAALTINTPTDKKIGSVGKVLPNMEIKIDPKTHEIFAKGPNISPGYFEDDEKTKEVFQDGWYKQSLKTSSNDSVYRTGDIGEIDKDGFLYITGREAFRIVLPNGQKVYPEDLEKKLNAHPLVVESCVVGHKTESGEAIHAVVITKDPQKLDSIISDVNQNLASHEQIMQWSAWKQEDFPRTPTLKIDRRKVTQTITSEGIESSDTNQQAKSDTLINIISKITKLPASKINESSILSTDLKMDSINRIELVSLIEQELAISLDEGKIGPKTKLSDLRVLIKEAPLIEQEIYIREFSYSRFFSSTRILLQNLILFPLLSLFVNLKIYGKENLKKIKTPAIFYFNHLGAYDGANILRMLPEEIRKKLVIPAYSEGWKSYRGILVEIFAGGFPFDKKKRLKASLELLGEFLDKNYNILIAPEGKYSKSGKLLSLKPGTGLMAVEFGVEVVPIKIDPSYMEIFPHMGEKFIEYIPKKRKKIWIKIGKPIEFPKGTDYDEATKIMQEALEKL